MVLVGKLWAWVEVWSWTLAREFLKRTRRRREEERWFQRDLWLSYMIGKIDVRPFRWIIQSCWIDFFKILHAFCAGSMTFDKVTLVVKTRFKRPTWSHLSCDFLRSSLMPQQLSRLANKFVKFPIQYTTPEPIVEIYFWCDVDQYPIHSWTGLCEVFPSSVTGITCPQPWDLSSNLRTQGANTGVKWAG